MEPAGLSFCSVINSKCLLNELSEVIRWLLCMCMLQERSRIKAQRVLICPELDLTWDCLWCFPLFMLVSKIKCCIGNISNCKVLICVLLPSCSEFLLQLQHFEYKSKTIWKTRVSMLIYTLKKPCRYNLCVSVWEKYALKWLHTQHVLHCLSFFLRW